MPYLNLFSAEPAEKSIIMISHNRQSMAAHAEAVNQPERLNDFIAAINDVANEDDAWLVAGKRGGNFRIEKIVMAQTAKKFRKLIVASVEIADNIALADIVMAMNARVRREIAGLGAVGVHRRKIRRGDIDGNRGKQRREKKKERARAHRTGISPGRAPQWRRGSRGEGATASRGMNGFTDGDGVRQCPRFSPVATMEPVRARAR
jgi:hypothetical protein